MLQLPVMIAQVDSHQVQEGSAFLCGFENILHVWRKLGGGKLDFVLQGKGPFLDSTLF